MSNQKTSNYFPRELQCSPFLNSTQYHLKWVCPKHMWVFRSLFRGVTHLFVGNNKHIYHLLQREDINMENAFTINSASKYIMFPDFFSVYLKSPHITFTLCQGVFLHMYDIIVITSQGEYFYLSQFIYICIRLYTYLMNYLFIANIFQPILSHTTSLFCQHHSELFNLQAICYMGGPPLLHRQTILRRTSQKHPHN